MRKSIEFLLKNIYNCNEIGKNATNHTFSKTVFLQNKQGKSATCSERKEYFGINKENLRFTGFPFSIIMKEEGLFVEATDENVSSSQNLQRH